MMPKELRDRLAHELNPVERFTDLFTGKDDRQDLTNTLLYELLQYFAGQEPMPGGGGDEFPSRMSVNIPLRVNRADVMRNIESLTTAEIPPTTMADCRRAVRMVVVVNNTFDQQVSVKVVGNDSEAHDSAFDIHTMNVASGARGAYGIKNEEWMPYIGVKVTPAANPTKGTINASVVMQEQVTENG